MENKGKTEKRRKRGMRKGEKEEWGKEKRFMGKGEKEAWRKEKRRKGERGKGGMGTGD